jgi:predicted nucleic-acid-binding Zn-ribbon protein
MSCKVCQSVNQRAFQSDLNIHFPGAKNLVTPTVRAFATLLVCMNCGFTEFVARDQELRELRSGTQQDRPAT